MRLKTRLTLLSLLLAWVPLGVAVWLLTDQMEHSFAASFLERSEAVQQAVGRRFEAVEKELATALERIAQDPILETTLLQPLEHGQFYGDPRHEGAIVREAERLITSPSIDTLRLVDLERGGHVIALGHRRGEEPADDEVVARADPDRTTSLMRRERVENPETGAADEVWTLQVVKVVGGRVALVGGRKLDEGLLGELVRSAAGEALVALDFGDNRVAATFQGSEPPVNAAGYDLQTSPVIGGADGKAAASLKVWVSREPLAKVLRDLWKNAGLLAGASGLVALLAGLWFSRRLSRPLEGLNEAATAVASGRRDIVVKELPGKDEVAQLTRAFNQMTLDLGAGEERLRQSERVAAWREIARRIAHEIKNPLFPIQMSIETLQKVWRRKHPDFEEIFDESTATILEEVARMKRIVSEFSNFARMPAPRPIDTDLGELVRSVASFHRDAAPEVRIDVVAPDDLMARVDPDQMRQVVTNLVQNALDALVGGGTADPAVTLTLIPQLDGGAELTVADNGPGMDEETRSRLFTPYFTTKATGTGLGLAIVHRIVAEHGGDVVVESEPGEGTRFVVTLPGPRERSTEIAIA